MQNRQNQNLLFKLLQKQRLPYDREKADYAVSFIQCLCHTKGTWAGKRFDLLPWQETIIRDLFGVIKPNGYRQFNTAYIEIPKKCHSLQVQEHQPGSGRRPPSEPESLRRRFWTSHGCYIKARFGEAKA